MRTLLVVASLLAPGCLPAFEPLAPDDAGAPAPDLLQATSIQHPPPDLAGVDGNGPSSSGRDKFDAEVLPIMQPRCSPCHGMDGGLGPAFIKPDAYDSLVAYPGIITRDPTHSLLITKGPHNGAVYFNDQEKLIVLDWLTVEAAVLPPTVDSTVSTKPIVLLAGPEANSVDLSPLCKNLGCAGASITFTAAVLGQALKVTDLKVHATGPSGLHIVHPIFIGVDPKGVKTADPVDTLDGYDVTYDNAVVAPLGPGLILLTNVAQGDRVSIAFALIERWDGVVQMGGCKAPDLFTQFATPQLKPCATMCHGGTNAAAQNALDLAHVTDGTQMGQAIACAQTLNRIDPAAPAMSDLLMVVDPGGTANHPYKFPDAMTFDAFAQAVTQWITAEK